ncbi:EF-P lysine aminoacylase GenX [Stieleria sp. JC731]|uniref:EF-P lysine aminoacylase EpmA n=1 Tax=Pirellulaceae TaxID=2691357 RepID=UPI001E50835E|nr:EF-P lysine aminoacylase EpmA [Stieleria sp. JC731]MCC9604044.1 EF-P lysine aminoacylase GenX [Stieleria sp. JC731]
MINVNHLAARSDLLRKTRTYFDGQGFLEVQPPCLSRDCVVDAYLDPISIQTQRLGVSDTRLGERYYLQTSPESAMKRMLAAGAPSIYSLGPVFRGGELGRHHNLEFTMLEWYEVGGSYESAIRLTSDYVCEMLSYDSADRMTYREAFIDAAKIDPLEASDEAIVQLAQSLLPDLELGGQSDRDDCLDLILSEKVVASLGQERPLILTDYPVAQAALAKRSPIDDRCAARFELFCQGIELANGYDELLDAEELERRYRTNNQKRLSSGRNELNCRTTLIEAMRQGMPECSGVALGFDRLLLAKTKASDISEVIPLPFWEA